MRRLVAGVFIMMLTALPLPAATVREVLTRGIASDAPPPADLVSPEGKTRWHLESIGLGAGATVAISRHDQGWLQETRDAAGATARVVISGADGERWLLPDHDPAQMKMGARVSLRFDETRDGLVDRLVAEIATVGIGWLQLPGDPQEVVLQRVLLFRQRAGERAMHADALIHRWVSPREGVLAEISGPVSADGRTRLAVDAIDVVEQVVSGAADLKVYADQLYRGNFVDVKYGFDKASGTPIAVSTLVPNSGMNNICDLVNLSTWNFSGITTGQETATTDTPSNAAETCNSASCGYAGYPPGGSLENPILERLDRNLTGTIRKDNQIVQRENRATDVTFWLRGGSQNESVSGGFGAGETRFCFTDEAGKARNEVPLWQLPHNDALGWYTQAGDSWSSVPVDKSCSLNLNKACTTNADCLTGEGTCVNACQQNFYNCQCGSCGGFLQTLYGRACVTGGQTFTGRQFGKIVKGGVVTLPSGHTLNALVVRNTTEFCTYTGSGCSFVASAVRTIVYYWQSPFVGSVALLRGAQRTDFTAAEISAGAETPCTNFTSVDFTDISYGLLPPVSITAGTVTDTSVSLSWNPGNDTHRIVGYKIYWDTDPGASSAYGFNSVANPGQVAFAGTTATISGLTPGATYYFTVTSLSDFTDPSSNVVTRYESIKYPTTVSGDPAFSYPVEVAASTTCTAGGTPTLEVTGLTVDKSGSNVHACWNATSNACAVGYDVLASDDKTSDVSWIVAGQVGLTTCWDGNPSQKYLLIRARGTSGTGPWGHYLH